MDVDGDEDAAGGRGRDGDEDAAGGQGRDGDAAGGRGRDGVGAGGQGRDGDAAGGWGRDGVGAPGGGAAGTGGSAGAGGAADRERLQGPWRAAFELAWESLAAGSLGIGAVVTDGAGQVVAAGRNRLLEPVGAAPHGQVAGSAIAHAEVNALAGVPFDGSRVGLVLWTTLEPCLLCSGAVVLAGVPEVRFAGPDPLWDGLAAVAGCTPFVADRWPVRTGPRADRLGSLGALLPLAHFTEHDPEGVVVEAYARRHPALSALAAELVAGGELRALIGGGADVADVAAALWDRLPPAP